MCVVHSVCVFLISVHRNGLNQRHFDSIGLSGYHSPLKGRSFGEMADFRSGPEKVQHELGTSCCARKQGSTQRMLETGQKDMSPLECIPIGQ